MCIDFKRNIQDILVKQKEHVEELYKHISFKFQNMSVDISIALYKIAYHIKLV